MYHQDIFTPTTRGVYMEVMDKQDSGTFPSYEVEVTRQDITEPPVDCRSIDQQDTGALHTEVVCVDQQDGFRPPVSHIHHPKASNVSQSGEFNIRQLASEIAKNVQLKFVNNVPIAVVNNNAPLQLGGGESIQFGNPVSLTDIVQDPTVCNGKAAVDKLLQLPSLVHATSQTPNKRRSLVVNEVTDTMRAGGGLKSSLGKEYLETLPKLRKPPVKYLTTPTPPVPERVPTPTLKVRKHWATRSRSKRPSALRESKTAIRDVGQMNIENSSGNSANAIRKTTDRSTAGKQNTFFARSKAIAIAAKPEGMTTASSTVDAESTQTTVTNAVSPSIFSMGGSKNRRCYVVHCYNSDYRLLRWKGERCSIHGVFRGDPPCDCSPPFRYRSSGHFNVINMHTIKCTYLQHSITR